MKFEIRHWGDPHGDDAGGMWVQFAAESAIHAYLERMPSRFEASFRLLFRFRSSVRPPLIVIRKIATRLFVSAAGDLLQICKTGTTLS